VRKAVITDHRNAANIRDLPIVSHILGVTTMRVRFYVSLFLGLSLCGCATIQDYQYNFVQRFRASMAYKENYGLWSACSKHYKDGWKQGYFDLSTGQCNEPPATPPHEYWDAKYQSLEGREAIDEWYSGWQDGATAAEQDGRPYFHPIVASPTAPAPDHAQPVFHGNMNGHGGGMEAIPPTPPTPTHDPQPQVHVGPAPQKFASQSIDDGELLDDSAPPENRPAPQGLPTESISDDEVNVDSADFEPEPLE
jgi:hypothetical protein